VFLLLFGSTMGKNNENRSIKNVYRTHKRKRKNTKRTPAAAAMAATAVTASDKSHKSTKKKAAAATTATSDPVTSYVEFCKRYPGASNKDYVTMDLSTRLAHGMGSTEAWPKEAKSLTKTHLKVLRKLILYGNDISVCAEVVNVMLPSPVAHHNFKQWYYPLFGLLKKHMLDIHMHRGDTSKGAAASRAVNKILAKARLLA
jgi:hypothetical protein